MNTKGNRAGQRYPPWRRALRFAGPFLFLFLLTRIEPSSIWEVLKHSDPGWLALAVAATPVMLLFKVVRWQGILRSQGIRYALGTAFLSYYVCLFVGNLTPGRLGEFVRAFHLVKDGNVPPGQAISSVAADRLFDLYALLFFGALALVPLAGAEAMLLGTFLVFIFMTGSLIALLWARSFEIIQRLGAFFGDWGRRITSPESILGQVRAGLRVLRLGTLAAASILTFIAYGIYFAQCFWMAKSLSLPVGFASTTAAVALGSLVALIPITVAGIGTREAAMIAYLSQQGVAPEEAFSFSILVFVNFYLISSAVGALLSLIKPVTRPE